ncbi:hypothetical protein MMC12_006991 [Toensbergia leucococca]|nr:hypothetical protein [Toensbergia leucococca]
MLLAVLTSLLIPAALSQMNLSGLPTCAQTCLSNATTAQGTCSNVDIHCLCSNINYIDALSCCLSQKCNANDQQRKAFHQKSIQTPNTLTSATEALTFNSQLCTTVNVTIPNFIGCSIQSTSKSSGASDSSTSDTSIAKNATSSSSSMMDMPTTATGGDLSGVTSFESAFTTPTTGPVATFTGGMLFQGVCTTAQFASVTLPGGSILQYPWLGCSNEQPGCCPFPLNEEGPLSICPMDYFTTSGACCPSGWLIYTSALAGQTPCYTMTPSAVLTAPSLASSDTASITMTLTQRDNGPQSTAITSQLFTLKYTLTPRSHSLSTGAKIGIAVGAAVAGVLLITLITTLILRRRRSQKLLLLQNIKNNTNNLQDFPQNNNNPSLFTTSTPPHTYTGEISPAQARTPSHHTRHSIVEMASPLDLPLRRSDSRSDSRSHWLPPQLSPTALRPIQIPSSSISEPPSRPINDPPNELPGDTFINEHHPAYSPLMMQSASELRTEGEEEEERLRTPGEVVSPVEERK